MMNFKMTPMSQNKEDMANMMVFFNCPAIFACSKVQNQTSLAQKP